jgi:hypothetical protein
VEGGEIKIPVTEMHNSLRLCMHGRVFVYLTLMKEHQDKGKKKVSSDTNNEYNNTNE